MKMNKNITLEPLYKQLYKDKKLKFRFSFIQPKPVLDILCSFSLPSCPQHSLKVLLLLNPTCLLNYLINCEQKFHISIRSHDGRVQSKHYGKQWGYVVISS
jgi:hypothetical protein